MLREIWRQHQRVYRGRGPCPWAGRQRALLRAGSDELRPTVAERDKERAGARAAGPCRRAEVTGQRAPFQLPNSLGDHQLYGYGPGGSAAVPVAVATFGESAALHIGGPRLVKMDTQGSEAMSQAGMRRHMPARYGEVGLLTELAPCGLRNAYSSAATLVAALEPLGMRGLVVNKRRQRWCRSRSPSSPRAPRATSGRRPGASLMCFASRSACGRGCGRSAAICHPDGTYTRDAFRWTSARLSLPTGGTTSRSAAAGSAMWTACCSGLCERPRALWSTVMRDLIARLATRISAAIAGALRADISRLETRLARVVPRQPRRGAGAPARRRRRSSLRRAEPIHSDRRRSAARASTSWWRTPRSRWSSPVVAPTWSSLGASASVRTLA